MTNIRTLDLAENEPPENAQYEHIMIPEGESFLWRLDDYPWAKNVWNYHPEIEIHLVRKSSGLCYIGDYIGQFEAGHLSIVGSNLPHDWITLPLIDEQIPGRDIVLQFAPETFLKGQSIWPEMNKLSHFFERASLGIEILGETAVKCGRLLESMEKSVGLKRLSQMIELLTMMSESTETKTLATQRYVLEFKPSNSKELKNLEKALTYIQEHHRTDLNISEVAKVVGMSDSSFSRFFKAQTGNTYTDHITILRIWTAKKLLKETDNPITDICYEAGFSNISNFNRTFLRQTEMKPSAYRSAARNI